MIDKKRIILLLFLVILGISLSTLFIYIYLNKNKDDMEETVIEEAITHVTLQVIDYSNDLEDKPIIWERVYNTQNATTTLYADGKEIKSYSGGVIDKVIDFSPETLEEVTTDKKSLSEDEKIGIIYLFSMNESQAYVADLLNNGYSLMRKVLTSNYAEVYLKNSDDKTIRILVFSDKMLMAELDAGVELDAIESYFN